MDSIHRADIVLSTAGREKGGLYWVLDVTDSHVLLADGKTRRVASPKRKNKKHVTFVRRPLTVTAESLRQGAAVTNRELRRGIKEACNEV